MDGARQEAARLKDEFISTEHLLLALAQDGIGGGVGRAFEKRNITQERIYQALLEVRGSQRVTDQRAESKYQALEKYSVDLTGLARDGRLDPVVGRDAEIRRVMQTLSRRTKNNPVLIGDAGSRQDSDRGGTGPAHPQRRRARKPEGQDGDCAGHGFAYRRRKIPGRIRRAA